MTKCPNCHKQMYPVLNEDKSINWKNVFHVDWVMVFIVISIILMIIGFRQTLANCKEVLTKPCEKLAPVCGWPTNSITTTEKNPTITIPSGG